MLHSSTLPGGRGACDTAPFHESPMTQPPFSPESQHPPLVLLYEAECTELVAIILGRGVAFLSDRSSFSDLSPNDEMLVRISKRVGRKVLPMESVGEVARDLHNRRKEPT